MSYQKLATLVGELLSRTENGEVRWEETAINGVYQVAFPHHTVQLSLRDDPENFNEDVVVTIRNDEGIVIEQAGDPDLKSFIQNPYVQMKAMYDTARRQALGVDKALDDLLAHLKKADF